MEIMNQYEISYTVEAESLEKATSLAYENVYIADLEVQEVKVRQVGGAEYRTFGEEIPTETNPNVAKRIYEPWTGA